MKLRRPQRRRLMESIILRPHGRNHVHQKAHIEVPAIKKNPIAPVESSLDQVIRNRTSEAHISNHNAKKNSLDDLMAMHKSVDVQNAPKTYSLDDLMAMHNSVDVQNAPKTYSLDDLMAMHNSVDVQNAPKTQSLSVNLQRYSHGTNEGPPAPRNELSEKVHDMFAGSPSFEGLTSGLETHTTDLESPENSPKSKSRSMTYTPAAKRMKQEETMEQLQLEVLQQQGEVLRQQKQLNEELSQVLSHFSDVLDQISATLRSQDNGRNEAAQRNL
ncbi:hypothetical protein Ddc_18475 [Ditylenchus destructor]|nr:hypothetical protein Ddc_18475 [Ditylenchus destructor]